MNTNFLQRGPVPVPSIPFNNASAVNNNLYRNNLLNQNRSLPNNANNIFNIKSAYNTSTYNNRVNAVNNLQKSKYQTSTFKKKVIIKNGKKTNSGSLLKSSRANSFNRVIRYGHKIRNIDINLDPEDNQNEDTESITSFHKPNSTLLQSNLNSTGISSYSSGSFQKANTQVEDTNPITRFFQNLFYGSSEENKKNNIGEIPLDTDEIPM